MLEVRFQGVDELQAKLTRIERSLDPEHIVDQSAAILLNRIRQRFLKQQAPNGTFWPESRAAARRTRQGRGGGTLFDTGSLFHSIEAVRGSAPGERLLRVNPAAINPKTKQSVGAYARKHNDGLRGLPRRQFLGFSDADVAIVKRIAKAAMDKAIKG